jgi:serine/threonine protein kinase
MLKRFRQEAQAAARLTHSNIVPVYGVGRCGAQHYYVMDLIDGMTVRDWIHATGHSVNDSPPTVDEAAAERRGTADAATEVEIVGQTLADGSIDPKIDHLPEPEKASEYFRGMASRIADVCDALDYAHRQGTLHRDIKPANLLFDRQGQIWITDFGLAKLEGPSDFTRTGDIVGTPQYMPPESFEGTYNERSEVYAVGLTLY